MSYTRVGPKPAFGPPRKHSRSAQPPTAMPNPTRPAHAGHCGVGPIRQSRIPPCRKSIFYRLVGHGGQELPLPS
jgi:hypothetical protein